LLICSCSPIIPLFISFLNQLVSNLSLPSSFY
jgi:hypothetical protein